MTERPEVTRPRPRWPSTFNRLLTPFTVLPKRKSSTLHPGPKQMDQRSICDRSCGCMHRRSCKSGQGGNVPQVAPITHTQIQF